VVEIVVCVLCVADIPLSYGLVDMNIDPSKINQADFIWDPTKETGLYFKVRSCHKNNSFAVDEHNRVASSVYIRLIM
jgi:hypothetical protein